MVEISVQTAVNGFVAFVSIGGGHPAIIVGTSADQAKAEVVKWMAANWDLSASATPPRIEDGGDVLVDVGSGVYATKEAVPARA